MYQKNCCRTCLSTKELYPIFVLTEHCEKYTNTIYEATGIKIEVNDSLPQKMCSDCISFINKSIKFRRKCEETQKILQDVQININIDTANEKNCTAIDISMFLDEESDFKDYDDNITLDSFQFNETSADVDVNKEATKHIDNKESFEKKTIKGRKKKKDTEDKKERSKQNIQCQFCQKVLTSKLSLRNHYKIHTGFDVVCEHCGKKFITRRLLLMHCRAKHGYEKTDKCSYCDYRASNAEQVKIHERLHTGEKPFVCAQCGAGFHRNSSYLQHVAIHLPDKTVQCDQCPARFKSVTLMRIHKNRHRPPQYTFKCGVCDNNFARRRNVARHLQRVHGLPADLHIQRLKLH